VGGGFVVLGLTSAEREKLRQRYPAANIYPSD